MTDKQMTYLQLNYYLNYFLNLKNAQDSLVKKKARKEPVEDVRLSNERANKMNETLILYGRHLNMIKLSCWFADSAFVFILCVTN